LFEEPYKLKVSRIAYTLSWIVVGLLLVDTATAQWLSVFQIIVFPAIVAIGLVAIVLSLAAIYRQHDRNSFLSLSIVVLVFTLWCVLPTDLMGAYVRAGLESRAYSEAVRELQAGGTVSCVPSQWCEIDEGPPRRLAFSWGGIVDNWVGVVYDPENAVGDARKYEKLFGGDMLGCTRLWDHYYFCGFT
jgi:hypothetical protein